MLHAPLLGFITPDRPPKVTKQGPGPRCATPRMWQPAPGQSSGAPVPVSRHRRDLCLSGSTRSHTFTWVRSEPGSAYARSTWTPSVQAPAVASTPSLAHRLIRTIQHPEPGCTKSRKRDADAPSGFCTSRTLGVVSNVRAMGETHDNQYANDKTVDGVRRERWGSHSVSLRHRS